MARTKKTEEVVETAAEEVVETAVEATPVEEVKEEVKEEAVPAEEAAASVPEEEVKEEPKKSGRKKKTEEPKVEKKVEEKKSTNAPFTIEVIGVNGIYTFKRPGLDKPKNKILPKGFRAVITEVNGNWGKISEDKWILLGGNIIKL